MGDSTPHTHTAAGPEQIPTGTGPPGPGLWSMLLPGRAGRCWVVSPIRPRQHFLKPQ